MRSLGVNQAFRFDEGILLHRRTGDILFFFMRAQHDLSFHLLDDINIKNLIQNILEILALF